MEYHKLQPSTTESSELIYLLVSAEDFEILSEKYEKKVLPYGTYVMDTAGIHYFVNWYSYVYGNFPTVTIKGKIVVDKPTLLLMMVFVAFDKKNKIPKILSKKCLANVAIVANNLI